MEDMDVLPRGTELPLSSKRLLCCTLWSDLTLSSSALVHILQLIICIFGHSYYLSKLEK